MKLRELGERELLARLRELLATEGENVQLGPLHDAAVVKPGHGQLVLKVDAVVEGRHFDLALSSPESVGWRALVRPLSDLAAVAARPQYALVTLFAPGDCEVELILELYRGLAEAADAFGVQLVGGETSGAAELALSVAVTGSVQADKAKGRSSARAEDSFWVGGSLGAAAAGLALLKAGGPGELARRFQLAAPQLELLETAVTAYEQPRPQLELGAWLGEQAAVHAVMDISDGLAVDLQRLVETSGACAELELNCLPLHPAAELAAQLLELDALQLALGGGDEYLLLWSAGPDFDPAGAPAKATRIGALLPCSGQRGRLFAGKSPLAITGWEHFSV